VADTDALTLDLIEFKLSARGYTVLTASDGEVALASALTYRPTLIVLDARIPVLDGFEVLRRLRRDKRTELIPVIMLTARRQDRDVLAALSVGAQDYLPKPFLPEELLRRVEKLLAGSGQSLA
jgi:DNA-binding response OmpR family regulator